MKYELNMDINSVTEPKIVAISLLIRDSVALCPVVNVVNTTIARLSGVEILLQKALYI